MGVDDDVRERLDDFLGAVVQPLEAEYADLLGDPGRRYGPSGVLAPAIVELKRRVRRSAASAGVYTLMVPTALGGAGLGAVAQYETWRHLYARCGPDRLLPYEAIGTFTSGPGAALGALHARARREWWPGILSGDKVLCFALSEAAGESAGMLGTVATPVTGGFVLRGQKKWVSRGGYADYALTYAVVGGADPPKLTAFMVPLREPGVEVMAVNRILGRAGGEEVTLAFRDVELADWQVVGALHGGGSVAASGALATALFTAGRFVGLAEWALTVAGGDRRELADHVVEVEGLNALSQRCAEHADAGRPVDAEVAMIRLSAPAVCGRVYEQVMRLKGSEGLTNEARLFDGWHQSWIVRVAQSALETRLGPPWSPVAPSSRPGLPGDGG